jgi:hypothetical protein
VFGGFNWLEEKIQEGSGCFEAFVRNNRGQLMRQLEPPGFLALNYGFQTPISVVIAHIIFGVVLGTFYTLLI